MRSFSFFVPGAPRGKGRSRSVMGRAKHYPDAKTVRAENGIGWIAHQAMLKRDTTPLSGPVKLTIVAMHIRPTSWPKRRQKELWKTSKPDLDNVIKLIKDGLNRVAWLDDAQVCAISAAKYYGDFTREGIAVTVEEMELTTCPISDTVLA
jgi:Holliday junction resolvase RusA-like endonuclease